MTSPANPFRMQTTDDLERLAGHPDTPRNGRMTMDQISFRIRYLGRRKDAEKRINDLVAAGFVIREDDAIVLKDWPVRKYRSDATSTERSRVHREMKGKGSRAPRTLKRRKKQLMQRCKRRCRNDTATILPPFPKQRMQRPYRITEIQIDHHHL